MKTDWLIGEELAALQNTGDPLCVSIIVPTHARAPERRVDPLQVQRAVKTAKEYLYYHYSRQEAKTLLEHLDELYGAIDFTHSAEGIGLFASANIKQSVSFYFPVQEKLTIGGSFSVRDWLYQLYYAKHYLVLLLNEQEARLYHGLFSNLEEVRDEHFPAHCTDDYEYSPASRSSSYAGQAVLQQFEKDKSHVRELRLQQCYRQADEALDRYMVGDTMLLVTGAGEDIHLFQNVSKHAVTATLRGNYFYVPSNELSLLSWEAIRDVLNEKKQETIREFEEMPRHRAVSGIYEIWKAVQEGRGHKLLVEKDFILPGYFVAGDVYNLYLHPPLGPHVKINDVIASIIRSTLDKSGEVVFVENDALATWQKMALITRY